MKKSTKAIFNKLFFSAIILGIILLMQPFEIYFFIKDIPFLFPTGIIGSEERDLLLLIQVVMLIVVIPVFILTFVFSWWYRADNKKAKYDQHLVHNRMAEYIWWGIPIVIVAVIASITWIKTIELDPYKPIESDKKPTKVQAVALQWKWLFIYPEEKIATVNYIQLPKDTPIHFDITADAPMNSLWIPRLGGMIYAMPGMKTQLYLISEEEGTFRGSSANISGKGFAGMTFETKVTSDEAYRDWIKSVKTSNNPFGMKEYEKLAKPSENNPVEHYQLTDDRVFHQILMKYLKPKAEA